MLEIGDAQIWWDESRKLVTVRSYRNPRGPEPTADGGGWCDEGASMLSWQESSDQARVTWLTELVIELHMMHDFPFGLLLREFAKVRQFAELGRQSQLMRCAISAAVSGRATEDVDGYARMVGLPTDDD